MNAMYYYFKKYIYYSHARIVSIKLKIYIILKTKKNINHIIFYNSQKCLFNLIKKVSLNPDKLKRL